MASSALETVLNHPAVWRGNECARVASAVPTGFAEMDAHLPGGGWPTGAITEIYPEHAGVGEMKLTLPAAARLTHEGRWIAVIAPPHVPYPPAFAAHGLRLERLVLIQAGRIEENLWAAEQALRATCCGAVLLWQDHVHERALRRIAAGRGKRIDDAVPFPLGARCTRFACGAEAPCLARSRPNDRTHTETPRRRVTSTHRARPSRNVHFPSQASRPQRPYANPCSRLRNRIHGKSSKPCCGWRCIFPHCRWRFTNAPHAYRRRSRS
jgi:cell division inhibitor SulA/protein ImuA